MRHALAAALVGATLMTASHTAFCWDFTLRDGLRGGTMGTAVGGAFSADGWTVQTKSDLVWYAVPRLVEGYVEFTVSGITMANLPLADHEIFSMYEAGYGITEPIRYGNEFRGNHYKCLLRIYGAPEVGRVGQQKLMWGMCPSGAPGFGDCGCSSFFEEPFGGSGAWDGTAQRVRIEWGAGRTRMLRNGAQAVEIDWSASGLRFGPNTLHMMIGSSRNAAVDSCGMPIGARFSDLVVEGNTGAQATCPIVADSGVASDAGVSMDAAQCLATSAPAVSAYMASASRGTSAVLRATYSHCTGASSIRVAQLWVGPTPAAGAASVSVAYEAGQLSLDGQRCAPGDLRVLAGANGSLDCARTTVTDNGGERTIAWALSFSPQTLGGVQGVFADAKSSSSNPEPRLGWTRLGDFEVVELGDGGAAMDGAVRDASARDGGNGGPVQGGCGCRVSARESGAARRWSASALVMALGLSVARRGRRRAWRSA